MDIMDAPSVPVLFRQKGKHYPEAKCIFFLSSFQVIRIYVYAIHMCHMHKSYTYTYYGM